MDLVPLGGKVKMEKYEVIQSLSGQMLIIKGGRKPEGNNASDIYILEVIPQQGTMTLGLNRFDQTVLAKESDGIIRISDNLVAMSYYLKEDSSIITRLKEVDDVAKAQKAGIVLQPNKGIVG